MVKEVYLITKNRGKLLAAQKVFSKFGIEIKNIPKDYPEIQADTSAEIAKFTAIQAANEFKIAAIREDHSLFIGALSGFPGPYTNYFDRNMPVAKLLELIKNAKDRSAYMEVAAAYAKPDGTFKEFVFRVPLKISEEIKGNVRNWDKVLMLANSEKTFAETKEEDNLDIWNKNYISIAKEILKSDE